MELKELAGERKLDAVDFSEESIKTWTESFEGCQVCRFRLDGVVYVAVEDPDDGYRSSMKDLGIDTKAVMKNVFPAIDVVCRYKTKGEYGDEDDILELICSKTGKIVLEVGTESIDNYYPGYIASFHPENMATNA